LSQRISWAKLRDSFFLRIMQPEIGDYYKQLNDFLSEKILEDGTKIARFEKIKHPRDFPEM
jgi:hypothetical protein